jgi:hypothetical protein
LNHENFFNSVKSLRYPHRARSLPATLAFVKHKTKQMHTWWKSSVLWTSYMVSIYRHVNFYQNKRNQFPLNRKTFHFIFPLIWKSINMLIASTMNQLAYVNSNYIGNVILMCYLFIYQFTIIYCIFISKINMLNFILILFVFFVLAKIK